MLSGLDVFVVNRCILKNVRAAELRFIGVHDEKLRALTRNNELLFTHDEVVTNLSSYELAKDEAEVLTNGLKFSIHPQKISRNKIMASFESIFYYMTKDISEKNKVEEVRNDLSHLAC